MLEITYIGQLGLILICIAYVRSMSLLLKLTVFFIPFSATAAINFGEPGKGSSVQLYMLFGLAWMFYQLLQYVREIQKNNRIVVSKTTGILLFFIFATFLSLLMPLYINGADSANATGRYGDYEQITFKSKNITQYLYLLIGAFLSIYIGHTLKEKETINIIKTYTYSVIFVMLWGLYELLSFYYDLDYLASIFNNNIHESAEGYTQVLKTGNQSVKRIASVTLEPSILAQVLLVLLPFYIYSCLNKLYIIGKIQDYTILFLLLVYIPLTTSSTAVLGLLFLMVILFYRRFRKNPFFLYYGFGLISLLLGLAYVLSNNIFYSLIIKQKAESSSGLERISTIIDGWNIFIKYPLLGVGWGSVSSYDLIIRLAASCGIIGLSIFSYFIYYVLMKLNFKSHFKGTHSFASSASLSLSVILFCNVISGFSFYLGHLWFILGLSLAIVKHKHIQLYP